MANYCPAMKEVNYNVLNIILISILLMFYWETLLKKWFRLSYILSLKSLSYPNLYAHFRTKQQHDLQCSIFCLMFLNNTEISHAYLLQPGEDSYLMSSVPFQCLSPCRVGTILLLWWQAALSDLRKAFFIPKFFNFMATERFSRNAALRTSLF